VSQRPREWTPIFLFVIALSGLFTQVEPVAKFGLSIVKPVVRRFRPKNADEMRRITRRQGFAEHVVAQLKKLAGEDWQDEQYAELEAEVEVEGRERIIPWLRHSPHRTINQRRVKSLSEGLARTTDRLVILEGEPGSGKSVALRHLAAQMARKAMKSTSASSVIPLYVNLKEFRRPDRPVDGQAIYDFIVESLTRSREPLVERFLQEGFDQGLEDGTWLLLFDSFDEIPDVLSSTENDGTVTEYALALNGFLSMPRCRAIIASREFHAPRTLPAPRYRIMPLTAEQQADLVRRSGLEPADQATLHAGLAVADPKLQLTARNPMFLGLVCAYVRSHRVFPLSGHEAYDSYIDERLTRDAGRIQQRYGMKPDLVRAIAEQIAFTMTAAGLGLSASRAVLRSVLCAEGSVSVRVLDKVLDVLEYAKLGSAADDPAGSDTAPFTFMHRRFQEYFATRVVLRAPDRVSPRDLLTVDLWRETAVTILQTQPPGETTPLLDEAARLLQPMVQAATAQEDDARDAAGFPWPDKCRPLLQLLDTGLGRAPERISGDVRNGCGRLLRAAWTKGRRHDRKWALSAALTADPESTNWLLEQAFESGSAYLGGAAFMAVSRMPSPPESVDKGIRQILLDLASSGEIRPERIALRAQLLRLPAPDRLLRVLRLLLAVRTIEFLLAAVVAVCTAVVLWPIAFDSSGDTQPRLAATLPAFILIVIGMPTVALWAFPLFRGRGNRRPQRRRGPHYLALASRVVMILPLLIAGVYAVDRGTRNPAPIVIGLAAGLYFVPFEFIVRDACLRASKPGVFALLTRPAFGVARGVRGAATDVRRAPSDAREAVSRALKDPREFLPWLGNVSGILFVCGLFLGWWPTFHWWQTRGIIGTAIRIALYGAGCWILFGFAVMLLMPFLEARDIRKTLRASAELDPSAFLAALDRMSTPYGFRAAFRAALGTDLAANPALLRTLSDLATAIDVMKSTPGGYQETSAVPGLGPEVSVWLSVTEKRSGLATYRSEVGRPAW